MSRMTILLLAVTLVFVALMLAARRLLPRGRPPGRAPHMNVLGGCEVAGLARAVREGVAQGGRSLDATMRRRDRVGALTDEEIAALQLCFRSRLAAPAGRS